MQTYEVLLTSIMFFVVAALYSSVGHAGASGYTAVLSLFSLSLDYIRPTSLILNLIVGLWALIQYKKNQLIDFKKVIPFILFSAPLSYFASQLKIDKKFIFLSLAFLLLFAAFNLLIKSFKNKSSIIFTFENKNNQYEGFKKFQIIEYVFWGSLIGFLSGITGTGGAIFFTPLVIARNWAEPKEASGLSVVFVLTNSLFGLLGLASSNKFIIHQHILFWAFVVFLGAFAGAYLGIKKFSSNMIYRVLSVVLLIAAVKLLTLV